MALSTLNRPSTRYHIGEQTLDKIVIRTNRNRRRAFLPFLVSITFNLTVVLCLLTRYAMEGNWWFLFLGIFFLSFWTAGMVRQLRERWLHSFTIVPEGLRVAERSLLNEKVTTVPRDQILWLMLDISSTKNARLWAYTGSEGLITLCAGALDEMHQTVETVSILWNLPLEFGICDQAQSDYLHPEKGRWIRFDPSQDVFTVQENGGGKHTYAMSAIAEYSIRQTTPTKSKGYAAESEYRVNSFELWITMTSAKSVRLMTKKEIRRSTEDSPLRQELVAISEVLRSLRPVRRSYLRATDAVSDTLFLS